jgi:DNA-binding NarL/FixJ family response regulator
VTPSQTRIFLVDDHPLVREWLATLLRQQPDFEVCGQAEDARHAFATMLADPPNVAIVDLSLKTSSGLDLIKELSDRLPETQVIVLSMHEEIFYAERAMRAGARGYVTKRESTHRIVEAVHEVQAGRLYANAELLAKLAERIVGRNQTTQAGSVETLSDRELEVFRRLGEGQSNRLIAEELHLSIKTVQAYSVRIKDKLGLANAAELVREAIRWTDQKNRHGLA